MATNIGSIVNASGFDFPEHTSHGFVTVLVGVAVATALVTELPAFGLRYGMKVIKLAAILAAIAISTWLSLLVDWSSLGVATGVNWN